MYVYTLAVITLCGLDLVVSRNSYTRMVHYKHTKNIHRRALEGGGELSQKPDRLQIPDIRCGAVELKCYEPILSYIDADGDFCGWKEITTFWELPSICTDLIQFSAMNWLNKVVKYTYKYIKTCDKVKIFQQCVKNNEV